jgi:hypothetical protein
MPLTKPKRSKVEGLDADLYVRELSTRERLEVADLFIDLDKKPPREQMQTVAGICVMACCDEQGDPVFESPDQALDEPFSTLEACVEAVFVMQGLQAPPKA